MTQEDESDTKSKLHKRISRAFSAVRPNGMDTFSCAKVIYSSWDVKAVGVCQTARNSRRYWQSAKALEAAGTGNFPPKKELTETKMERDFIKKCAAYFLKQTH